MRAARLGSADRECMTNTGASESLNVATRLGTTTRRLPAGAGEHWVERYLGELEPRSVTEFDAHLSKRGGTHTVRRIMDQPPTLFALAH